MTRIEDLKQTLPNARIDISSLICWYDLYNNGIKPTCNGNCTECWNKEVNKDAIHEEV